MSNGVAPDGAAVDDGVVVDAVVGEHVASGDRPARGGAEVLDDAGVGDGVASGDVDVWDDVDVVVGDDVVSDGAEVSAEPRDDGAAGDGVLFDSEVFDGAEPGEAPARRPESLTSGDLDEVWQRVRERLERQGLGNRGRVRLPELGSGARLTLAALLGRPVRSTVDLGALEESLRGLEVGADLPAALGALGFPVSLEPATRRDAREATRSAHAAARGVAATWPEPWASAWIDDVIKAGLLSGLETGAAVRVVTSVRAVLDRLQLDRAAPSPLDRLDRAHAASPLAWRPLARVDLAAEVLGSAHALDAGTVVGAATTRALVHELGEAPARALWERAGAHLELTSGAVLTWGLPLYVDGGVAELVEVANEAGVPLHLTRFALREHPVAVVPGADVLVTENPRVVEAAAQCRVSFGVVATNGQPSAAVLLLVEQLVAGGAAVRYHGDFDTAGLAICGRMHGLGLVPWHMDAVDYAAALADAAAAGAELPTDRRPVPATPWDPDLQALFARHGRAVHEERLLDLLLSPP